MSESVKNILIVGVGGQGTLLASKLMGKVFTDREEALSVIEKAILFYREQGKTGERFAATIDRIGFEAVEAELLSDAILDRKDAILSANLHEKGGATC